MAGSFFDYRVSDRLARALIAEALRLVDRDLKPQNPRYNRLVRHETATTLAIDRLLVISDAEAVTATAGMTDAKDHIMLAMLNPLAGAFLSVTENMPLEEQARWLNVFADNLVDAVKRRARANPSEDTQDVRH